MKIKTLSVWSCTGGNVSELSFSLACRIAEESRTLLCELPCLGLPRLGFISEHMDRIRNTETAILTLDREEELSWQLVNESRPGLWVLPASVYAIPDCPGEYGNADRFCRCNRGPGGKKRYGQTDF
mgnify:CR=1 FL=1